MPKVFIVNKGAHNHDDAKRFGKLVYMTEGAINRYATSRMYREFCYHLCDSKPEDYILITGLTVMASIACSVFARIHGKINLLLFRPSRDSYEGHYVERVVMIDELIKDKEDKDENNKSDART